MRVLRMDPNNPSRAALEEAAGLLRAGQLVAFPTETVYGLGANALDERAVQLIYEVKGRPEKNPIIVHVPDAAAARALAAEWSPAAETLSRAFWPGPLTLVVRKTDAIPSIVTAGGQTVGLRVPAHPIALALLRQARIPIAAPSANRSNQVSPTTAEHVARSLGDQVPLILDGGPTTVGIESTVVDVTGRYPRVLRPGMISADAIAARIGVAVEEDGIADGTPRSPGLLPKHYAPRASVRLVASTGAASVIAAARAAIEQGKRVGVIAFSPSAIDDARTIVLPQDVEGYARAIYAAMHELDAAGCDLMLIERPPETAKWAGIVDRLERAAS
jgi:L-threonylcarbamoyladenylate synthase